MPILLRISPLTARAASRFSAALIAVFALSLSFVLTTAPARAEGGVAPLGYQLFCLTMPAECQPGGRDHMSLDDAKIALLKAVNARVNASIRPKHDGEVDVWSVNVSVGDCEDYVLTKRHVLIAAGLPPSALRIGYVKTRSGEGNAILIIKADGRDLVLDNLVSAVRPLSQTGYRLISASGANPLRWS